MIFRKDRIGRRGGVLLAVQNHLPVIEIPSPSCLEVLAISLAGNSVCLIIAYVPPSLDLPYLKTLLDYFSDLFDTHRHVLILGDFNCPDVDWNLLHSTSPHSSLLCDFVFRHNLSQLVSSPTHVKGNILDLVLTTSPQFILNLTVLNTDFRYSDHFPLTFDLALLFVQHSKSILPEILDYSKADFDGMNTFLLEYDYSDFLSLSDVDALWVSLRSIITETINRFIPKVVLRRSLFPKWYTKDIRHLIKRTCTLRRKCKQNPTPYLIDKLSCFEQDLGQQMSSAKVAFESNLVFQHSSNRSAIFRYLSSITNQRSLPPIMQLGSVSTSSDQEKADLFNKYFFQSSLVILHPFCPSVLQVTHSVPLRSLLLMSIRLLGHWIPLNLQVLTASDQESLSFVQQHLLYLFITYFQYHYLLVVYLRSGKHISSPLFSNLAQNQISLITGLYLCCAQFQKCWRRSYMIR